MVRLFSALSALLIAATGVSLSVRGAELLYPVFSQPSRWFMPVCVIFTVFCLISAGRKMRRSKLEKDGPLTPLVHHLPSGLREL
jgi:hypothetical protein